MSTELQKLAIIERLMLTADRQKLSLVQAILDGEWVSDSVQNSSFWDSLPAEMQESLLRAVDSIKKDGGVPHEDVMSWAKNKYGIA